MSEYANMFVCI